MADAAVARRFLHCNLNCADLDASRRFYEETYGLRVAMRVDRKPQDGSVLGLDGTIECDTSFLYDHRGPRASPGLELVQWHRPRPQGRPYDDRRHPGLQSLGFAVTEADGVSGADPDGVSVERILVAEAASPELRWLGLSCTDLDRSIRWYQGLGFAVDDRADHDDRSTAELRLADDPSCSLRLTRWQEPPAFGRAYSVANHRGLYRFALSVDDIGAAHTARVAAGDPPSRPAEYVKLDGTPIDGMWILFLRDPDGVVVELVERPRSAFRTL